MGGSDSGPAAAAAANLAEHLLCQLLFQWPHREDSPRGRQAQCPRPQRAKGRPSHCPPPSAGLLLGWEEVTTPAPFLPEHSLWGHGSG